MPADIPTPPPLESFGAWRTASGRWGGDTTCNDGPCVAIADGPDGWVAVTDTKHPEGPALTFTADEWADFKQALASGDI